MRMVISYGYVVVYQRVLQVEQHAITIEPHIFIWYGAGYVSELQAIGNHYGKTSNKPSLLTQLCQLGIVKQAKIQGSGFGLKTFWPIVIFGLLSSIDSQIQDRKLPWSSRTNLVHGSNGGFNPHVESLRNHHSVDGKWLAHQPPRPTRSWSNSLSPWGTSWFYGTKIAWRIMVISHKLLWQCPICDSVKPITCA